MAYLLKTNHNLDLPKRLQIEFDEFVQNYADTTKKEVEGEGYLASVQGRVPAGREQVRHDRRRCGCGRYS